MHHVLHVYLSRLGHTYAYSFSLRQVNMNVDTMERDMPTNKQTFMDDANEHVSEYKKKREIDFKMNTFENPLEKKKKRNLMPWHHSTKKEPT